MRQRTQLGSSHGLGTANGGTLSPAIHPGLRKTIYPARFALEKSDVQLAGFMPTIHLATLARQIAPSVTSWQRRISAMTAGSFPQLQNVRPSVCSRILGSQSCSKSATYCCLRRSSPASHRAAAAALAARAAARSAAVGGRGCHGRGCHGRGGGGGAGS